MLMSPALALVNAVIQGNNLKRFLEETPELNSSLDLERFKAIAGRQMHAALVQGALLLIAPAGFFWGLFVEALTPGDFVWILLPSVVVILAARSFRGLELKAWSLPATDQYLADQRDHVVKVWRSKPLPDW